jgi:hypothetical protein
LKELNKAIAFTRGVCHYLNAPGIGRQTERKAMAMMVANANMFPMLIGKALLIPRVTYWPDHGWRGEVIGGDHASGAVSLSEFVETRQEARRLAQRAALKMAERYVD